MGFEQFGFSDELMNGLDAMNFKEPTPIQVQAIPEILAGRDLIASAQTGTGKTAAFLLPILEKCLRNKPQHIDTLVIVPTRELGLQIDQQLEGFSYFLPFSNIAVYGGGDGKEFETQKKALQQGTEIVVATPGKLLSLLNMGFANMKHLKHLVLDEVDRMLDMGFIEDIQRILSFLPEEKQTLFFSATMPPKIRQLALKLLKDPVQINISISKPAAGIKQSAYLVNDPQKLGLLKTIFNKPELKSAILFAGTKQKVKEVERELRKMKLNVAAIHSDIEQAQREEVLLNFRNRKTTILVATDVVSRGIDVQGIELVVNYDVPGDPEDYVHRIGRTARAETTGEAITLINRDDIRRFRRIEQMIERDIDKLELPEGMPPGPDYNASPDRHSSGDRHRTGSRGPSRNGKPKNHPRQEGPKAETTAAQPSTNDPNRKKKRRKKPFRKEGSKQNPNTPNQNSPA
jgi:superfamily II DNA/RNA helicase